MENQVNPKKGPGPAKRNTKRLPKDNTNSSSKKEGKNSRQTSPRRKKFKPEKSKDGTIEQSSLS